MTTTTAIPMAMGTITIIDWLPHAEEHREAMRLEAWAFILGDGATRLLRMRNCQRSPGGVKASCFAVPVVGGNADTF
jgi:hypothetical protein